MAAESCYVGACWLRGRCSSGVVRTFVVFAVCVVAAWFTVSSLTLPRLPDLIKRAEGVGARGPLLDSAVFIGKWLTHTYAAWPYQAYFGALCATGLVFLALRSPVKLSYLILPATLILTHWTLSPNALICARYGIIILLPVVILGAVAMTALGDMLFPAPAGKADWGGWAVALILLAPLFWSAGQSLSVYHSRERYPFRPAARYVLEQNRAGDPVCFAGFGYDKFSFYEPGAIHLAVTQDLKRRLDSDEPFWLVYWFPEYFNSLPAELGDEIQRRGELRLRYAGFPLSLTEHDYETFCWYIKGRQRPRGKM